MAITAHEKAKRTRRCDEARREENRREGIQRLFLLFVVTESVVVVAALRCVSLRRRSAWHNNETENYYL